MTRPTAVGAAGPQSAGPPSARLFLGQPAAATGEHENFAGVRRFQYTVGWASIGKHSPTIGDTMPVIDASDDPLQIRVSAIDVIGVSLEAGARRGFFESRIHIKNKDGVSAVVQGQADSEQAAVASSLSKLCIKPLGITHFEINSPDNEHFHCAVAVTAELESDSRNGAGRYVSNRRDVAIAIAILRAAAHAGLLAADFRANNQKVLRQWSSDLIHDLCRSFEPYSLNQFQQLLAAGIALEYFNRVASAAVVTAVNHPRPDSILSLFDTSSWLFDGQGRRRDCYTDTSLWLAWYPGIENDDLTVDAVIRSMPAAPATAIPWIVKVFENPDSWLRFRGAVDLEDHDVLHVLLGRGLQDQDEAFVLGFAMGTAKRVSWLEYRIFKLILARLYPEPYRIPYFLQPAFDLGVQCGQQTGARDLYKRPLHELRSLTLGEARSKTGIDMRVVRKYYELEQQRIPITIASLRLP